MEAVVALLSFMILLILFTYADRRLGTLEIIACSALAVTINNELLNVISLNVESYKGINIPGKWLLVEFHHLLAPMLLLWTLHYVVRARSGIGRALAVLTGACALAAAEFLTVHASLVQLAYWPLWLSLLVWLCVAAVLVLFLRIYRTILLKEAAK